MTCGEEGGVEVKTTKKSISGSQGDAGWGSASRERAGGKTMQVDVELLEKGAEKAPYLEER